MHTDNTKKNYDLVISKENRVARLDEVAVNDTVIEYKNGAYTAYLDESAYPTMENATAKVVIKAPAGTVKLYKDNNELVSKSGISNIWSDDALQIDALKIDEYRIVVTSGNGQSSASYKLIIRTPDYQTGLDYVKVDAGAGETELKKDASNTYSMIISNSSDHIKISAGALNKNAILKINRVDNDTYKQTINSLAISTMIKDIYIPIDVTDPDLKVTRYTVKLTRKNLDDSIKTLKVDDSENLVNTKKVETINGKEHDVYTYILKDAVSDFSTPVIANIYAETANAFAKITGGMDTAPDPVEQDLNVWSVNKFRLADKEVTVFEIKTKSEDSKEIKVSYLRVYKKTSNTELESIKAYYKENGKETSQAAQVKDGEYHVWVPSTASLVDIEAISKSLMAGVKVGSHVTYKEHFCCCIRHPAGPHTSRYVLLVSGNKKLSGSNQCTGTSRLN